MKVVSLRPLPYDFLIFTDKADYDGYMEGYLHEVPWPSEPSMDACIVTYRPRNIIAACFPVDKLRTRTLEAVRRIIVHESVHIWQIARRWAAEYSPGDEIEAYYIDYIYSEIARHVEDACVAARQSETPA